MAPKEAGTPIPPEGNELYGLPLDQFTTHRNQLVSRLKEEGRDEEASRVRQLRKPTTDAWALNQVAHHHSEMIDRLVTLNTELRQAEDADTMRRLSESRGQMIDEILKTSASALEAAGHSSAEAVLDRMTITLLATAGDPEAEQALRQGTLERVVQPSGRWPETSLRAKEISAEESEELERLEVTAQSLAAKAAQLRSQAVVAKEALEEVRRRATEADEAARDAERAASDAREQVRRARQKARKS